MIAGKASDHRHSVGCHGGLAHQAERNPGEEAQRNVSWLGQSKESLKAHTDAWKGSAGGPARFLPAEHLDCRVGPAHSCLIGTSACLWALRPSIF